MASASATNRVSSPNTTRNPGMGENSSSGRKGRRRMRSIRPISPLRSGSSATEVRVVVRGHERSLVDSYSAGAQVVQGHANPLAAGVVSDVDVAVRAVRRFVPERQVGPKLVDSEGPARAVRYA